MKDALAEEALVSLLCHCMLNLLVCCTAWHKSTIGVSPGQVLQVSSCHPCLLLAQPAVCYMGRSCVTALRPGSNEITNLGRRCSWVTHSPTLRE